MVKWLTAMIIIICLTIGLAEAQEKSFERKRYPIETPYYIYKTQEEIAWEMVMYAIKNIPSMTFRVKHYEDLLEAYRQALNVIKEPEKPVPLP